MLTIILIGLMLLHQIRAMIYTCNTSAPCGCSSEPAVTSRIFGGETAVNNSWGWTVSLHLNNTYYCGGVLISQSWVLSAAACLRSYRAADILVSAATHVRLGRKQSRSVIALILHPNFDEYTWLNNLALLKLSSPFNMTDSAIARICIPPETIIDYPPVNSSIVAVGWGFIIQGGSTARLLQQATFQRIDDRTYPCNRSLTNATNEFCAGGINKTTCNGDLGGPVMMYTLSQQWVLIGIISFNLGCYDTGYPSIVTRVIPALSWITARNITDLITVTTMESAEDTIQVTTAVAINTSITTTVSGTYNIITHTTNAHVVDLTTSTTMDWMMTTRTTNTATVTSITTALTSTETIHENNTQQIGKATNDYSKSAFIFTLTSSVLTMILSNCI